jgi:hypothetical protein
VRRVAASEQVLNVPNALSALRLVGVPVFLWAILARHDAIALLTLMVSGVSDYLDGKIARRYGLVARLSRSASFGPAPASQDELLRLESTGLDAVRAGQSLAAVYHAFDAAYRHANRPEALRERPQGGIAGYLACELAASPSTATGLETGMAFAFNPGFDGIGIEDTFLLGENGLENLTLDPQWPAANIGGRLRPLAQRLRPVGVAVGGIEGVVHGRQRLPGAHRVQPGRLQAQQFVLRGGRGAEAGGTRQPGDQAVPARAARQHGARAERLMRGRRPAPAPQAALAGGQHQRGLDAAPQQGARTLPRQLVFGPVRARRAQRLADRLGGLSSERAVAFLLVGVQHHAAQPEAGGQRLLVRPRAVGQDRAPTRRAQHISLV